MSGAQRASRIFSCQPCLHPYHLYFYVSYNYKVMRSKSHYRGGWSLRKSLSKYRNRPNALKELADRTRTTHSRSPRAGHGNDYDDFQNLGSLFDDEAPEPSLSETTYRPKRQFASTMWHDSKSGLKTPRSYVWRGGKRKSRRSRRSRRKH